MPHPKLMRIFWAIFIFQPKQFSHFEIDLAIEIQISLILEALKFLNLIRQNASLQEQQNLVHE